MPTRIPTHAVQLLIIMILIRRHFFLLVPIICIVSLGDWLEERTRGSEGEIVFVHILLTLA